MGWTYDLNMKKIIEEKIKDPSIFYKIKLIGYHGRTWFESPDSAQGFLQDIAIKNHNLKFEILLVDDKAAVTVREGASIEQHKLASSLGMKPLLSNRCLPGHIRKQFDIRTYGFNEDDSYLRGVIIENNSGNILFCHVISWRFGLERGIYGRDLEISGESSIALLCRKYFDDVFKRSNPVGKWPVKTIFLIRRHHNYILAVVCAIITSYFGIMLAENTVKSNSYDVQYIYSIILSSVLWLYSTIASFKDKR